jgi:pimeloyl-ACP methyl ester carboxylesterase
MGDFTEVPLRSAMPNFIPRLIQLTIEGVMKSAKQERYAAEALTLHPRQRLIGSLPVKERRLKLNGVITSVLEGGEGPPMVLLHGAGAYGAQWIRTIPALTATHRVIAPDLPGHGASDFFNGAPTRERVTGWLDDLIECTCTKAPILVGHTLGGAIAANFAAEAGRRLAGLVLVDTLGLAAFRPAPAFGAALQEFLHAPTEHTHDGLWGQCVYDFEAVKHSLGEKWQWIKAANLTYSDPARMAALGAWMEEFGFPAIPPSTLSRIDVPTTLIWGRHDRATPLAVAEAVSQRFGWRLEVIDGAADDPTLEQPEAFLGALGRAIEPLKRESAK